MQMVARSSETLEALTEGEAVARARNLVPKLRELAPQAESQRRLPLESLRLVNDAELIRVIQPRSCGGHELSMRAHVDVVSTLAEGCSATAWVVGVAHAHSWMMGHISKEAQQEVYGENPDTLVAGVISPRGKAQRQPDGSYRLNGFWPFGSGSERSSWLLLGAEVLDENGQIMGISDFLIPTSEATLRDDWFVAGLQGTGSCSIVLQDAPVPAYRMLPLDRLIERDLPSFGTDESGWLSKAQAIPVLAICISAGALGTAKGAMAEFLRAMPNKNVMYTPHISHEWIPNQVIVGHAASLIHAAELLLYRVADDIDHYARADENIPEEIRGRIRMDCSLAARFCLDAVERLFMNGGASGLSLSSPVQRAARDLRATNMHGLLLLETSAEVYGRILLGLKSNTLIY